MRTELKILRIKHRLTQAQLAEKLGVSYATYNLIEQASVKALLSFGNGSKRNLT